MKKVSLLSTLIFLIFLFSSCGGGGSSSSSYGGGGTISNPKWTFMVYMDADNNLDEYAVKDLQEMMQVGSNSLVNIIVIVDRADNNKKQKQSFTTTKIFYVQQNNLMELQDLGEKDMSDPKTLTDFINYVYANYKADNYALVLWDHGGGYKELQQSIKNIIKKHKDKGMFQDDTTSQYSLMTLSQIAEAIKNSNLKNVDVLAIDACLMGMAEVLYEFKDLTNYLVFSEANVPADGYPYTTILQTLTLNPNITANQFAFSIVDKYKDYYDNLYSDCTLSAINTNYTDELITKLNDFANALKNTTKPQALIGFIANKVIYFSESFPDYIDLGDFAYQISVNSDIDDLNLKEKATNLYSFLANSNLIINIYNGSSFSNCKGLSIYLPSPYWYIIKDQDGWRWSDIYSLDYNDIALTENQPDWKNFILYHINNFTPYIKNITKNANEITITGYGFGQEDQITGELQYYSSKIVFNDTSFINAQNCNSWDSEEIKYNDNSKTSVYVECGGRQSNTFNIP